MQKLAKFADYITINISSPNTANLREFHKRENLERLLNLVIMKEMQHQTNPNYLLNSPQMKT